MHGLGLLPRIIVRGGGSVNLVRTKRLRDLDLPLLSTTSSRLSSNVALRLVPSPRFQFNTITTVTRRSRLDCLSTLPNQRRRFLYVRLFPPFPPFVRLQVLSPMTFPPFYIAFPSLSINCTLVLVVVRFVFLTLCIFHSLCLVPISRFSRGSSSSSRLLSVPFYVSSAKLRYRFHQLHFDGPLRVQLLSFLCFIFEFHFLPNGFAKRVWLRAIIPSRHSHSAQPNLPLSSSYSLFFLKNSSCTFSLPQRTSL